MVARLTEVQGVDGTYAETLATQGLRTTEQLLESASSVEGRRKLAVATGISENLILEWVHRADLMRIEGVGSEFSDLLEASGVNTVEDLATHVPATLRARLAEVNEARKLTRRTPFLAEVEKWVSEARRLRPMVAVGVEARGLEVPKPVSLEASPLDDFWANPSLEELAEQQGIRPVTTLRELAGPSFADEEVEELLAELRAIRSAR